MKLDERGFTIIELAVAVAIIAIVGTAASTSIFHVIEGTGRTNDSMSTVCQVQNAGYWISCDTQAADSVDVDGLEYPDFLAITWTEQDYDGGDPIYHSATYFFEDLTDGIGKLKRNHWSSAGADEYTLVAKYIYYDPDDPDNTSKASYQNPVLTVRLTTRSGDTSQSGEYKVARRPNLD